MLEPKELRRRPSVPIWVTGRLRQDSAICCMMSLLQTIVSNINELGVHGRGSPSRQVRTLIGTFSDARLATDGMMRVRARSNVLQLIARSV